MAKKTGGPAFPVEVEYNDGEPIGRQTSPVHGFATGLSIRDWFAGQAMQAMFAGPGARDVADRDDRYDETNWAQVVASNAYEMADAMLAERAK